MESIGGVLFVASSGIGWRRGKSQEPRKLQFVFKGKWRGTVWRACFVKLWRKNESETKEGQLVLFHCVDGQNPAPPGTYITHSIVEQAIYQLVQDFWTTSSSKNVGLTTHFLFSPFKGSDYLQGGGRTTSGSLLLNGRDMFFPLFAISENQWLCLGLFSTPKFFQFFHPYLS